MEPPLILETTFLIDFERERRSDSGKTLDFLRAHPRRRLAISHTIAGELAAGASLAHSDQWEAFLRPFLLLDADHRTDWQYGRVFRYLKQQGRLIGTNDLWIAAAALAHQCPLVTANAAPFRRVPDLEVFEYR